MAVGGVSGATHLSQMLELNRQLNTQAVQRMEQTRQKTDAAVTQIISQAIAGQQRALDVGNTNLKLGQIINTTA